MPWYCFFMTVAYIKLNNQEKAYQYARKGAGLGDANLAKLLSNWDIYKETFRTFDMSDSFRSLLSETDSEE
jgi:hypothetical protein